MVTQVKVEHPVYVKLCQFGYVYILISVLFRKLRSELNASKVQVANRHTENTDLKKEIYKLQKELRKRRKTMKQKKMIRQYQHLLNLSNLKNSKLECNLDDSWQAVSDR